MLPYAAIIGSRIFCVHGGLSPMLANMEEINEIKRPTEIEKNSLICDILWSDPKKQEGWSKNKKRNISYCFGSDVVSQFLKKFDFDLICRSHEVVEDGY